jgi:sugar O-acyltransferase (sialic acid O-acetyltransferase NeuD family)
MKIAIFGGRGSGEDAAQSLARVAAGGTAIEIAGYLNDELAPGTPLLGGRVLGRFEEWTKLQEDIRFVAPLHKAGHMQARVARIEELGVPRERWTTVLDPNAAVASSATIGHGVVLGPFAVVGPGASLGMHSVVRAQAQVSHDVTLGDFVFIGGGSVVSGYCRLDVGAYVGPGAVLRDSISVGRFAVVGVGAVVVADVPDFAVVAGNPARPLSQAR